MKGLPGLIWATRVLGVLGRSVFAGLLAVTCLAAGGCNTASMQPGDLGRIQIHSDQPRAGNVYLLRGFIGVWSYGIDGLSREINEAGIRATVYRNEQWREVMDAIIAKYKDQEVFEPLVLVGHSWGADHAIELAQRLEAEHIPVDLIVTLDPVTPPRVPGNVKWCCNIYQPHPGFDTIPFFRGVPLEKAEGSPGLLQNLNIRAERQDLLEPDTDHYNIEKNLKIHKEVIGVIQKVCPTREDWVRQHPSYKPPAAKPAPGEAGAVSSLPGRTVKGGPSGDGAGEVGETARP